MLGNEHAARPNATLGASNPVSKVTAKRRGFAGASRGVSRGRLARFSDVASFTDKQCGFFEKLPWNQFSKKNAHAAEIQRVVFTHAGAGRRSIARSAGNRLCPRSVASSIADNRARIVLARGSRWWRGLSLRRRCSSRRSRVSPSRWRRWTSRRPSGTSPAGRAQTTPGPPVPRLWRPVDSSPGRGTSSRRGGRATTTFRTRTAPA